MNPHRVARRGASLLAILLIQAVPPIASGAIWIVEPDGTGDFATIQEAVDFASDGDEIRLGDGTFSGAGNGEIDYSGKAIVIRSASGDPDRCTIGNSYRPGFLFVSDEGNGSVLDGVTVLRGGGFPCRAAIECVGSSPTIRNLVVREALPIAIRCVNSSASFENLLVEGTLYTAVSLDGSDATFRDVELRFGGGNLASRGILCNDGSPTLENVTVREGSCPAMSFRHGTPLLTGCLVEANTRATSRSPGTISLHYADATIENTSILGNGTTFASLGYLGSGLAVSWSSPTVRDCIITGNRSWEGGGVKVSGVSSPTFERCTIAGNEARRGGGIHVSGSATVRLERTIVWGNCATDLGPDGYLHEAASVIQAECTDLVPSSFEGPGRLLLLGDVLETDPLFCEPIACPGMPTAAGVYSLDGASPALNHSCGAIGALGKGCGTTSIETASWGRIKSLYRVRIER